jgi:hypothetical protein
MVMKRLPLSLIVLTLQGCPSSITGASNNCPAEPNIVLDPKNVQEVILSSQMLSEPGIANKDKSIGYAFEGKKGQKLKYETDDDICVWLYTPDSEILNTTVLPKTGKYIIQVSATKGSKTFKIAMGLDVVESAQTPPGSSSTSSSSSSSAGSISQDEAVELITNWQRAKRKIFAPPFDRDLGYQLLTGEAYRKNVGAADGSVAWLSNNNAYYTYGLQEVDSVSNFSQNGNNAIIDVITSEQRTLCLNGRPIYDKNTTFSKSKVRYDLRWDSGQWKIENYNTIQSISSSANLNPSCSL